MATSREFVEDLAARLRASLPTGALIYLVGDPIAQEGLRAFAEVAERGLDAVGARSVTVEQVVADLRAAKTAAIGKLQFHHKSIEAALADALRAVEAEARRRTGS